MSAPPNHRDSKRWIKYAIGYTNPNETTLSFVDLVVPRSSITFYVGPHNLWESLWGEIIFEPCKRDLKKNIDSPPKRGARNSPKQLWRKIDLNICKEDVEEIINVPAESLDLIWLSRAITIWRKRSELAQSGSLNDFPNGLYEGIVLAMDQPNIKVPLQNLNIWSLIRKEITVMEEKFLKKDIEKTNEILLLGHALLKIGDPIQYYLNNPVEFLMHI